MFSSSENDVYMSVSSIWEISFKVGAGKLKLPEPPWTFVPRQRKLHGIEILEIGEGAALYEPRLPKLHSDPFDRMLICQAIDEGCALLTPDELIAQYPVRVIW